MEPTNTPLQVAPGLEGALPTTPSALRELGNNAVASKSFKRAVHLFTLGINIASSGMPCDKEGNAESPATLAVANTKSEGELLKLLCNRSMCHLKTSPADHDAARECLRRQRIRVSMQYGPVVRRRLLLYRAARFGAARPVRELRCWRTVPDLLWH